MEFTDSQHQKRRDHKDEKKQYHEEKLKQASQEIQQKNQQIQPSPPSPSSSPSHEFSFTISLQPSTTTSTTPTMKSATSNIPVSDKTKSSPPAAASSFALDLSPADEIFFHGHLLPLHLLSHLPVSPRSSTNSLDSFTLPIKESFEDIRRHNQNQNQNQNRNQDTNNITNNNKSNQNHVDHHESRAKSNKPKSFSLFGLSSKWRKENIIPDNSDGKEKERQKRKLKLVDVSHVLKRYVRMVRPLLSFGNRGGNVQFHRQSYSYSGNLSLRRKPEFRGRRGEFSAPASMRTSPTNSGHFLVAAGTLSSTSSTSTSDSTMEELQAAIQAAIAHCKNSIAMEKNIN